MRTKGLKGIEIVMKNLNKVVKDTKQKSFAGLIDCGILIRRETEKGSPITPLDTSNLTNSWFITTATKSLPGVSADKSVVAEAQALTKTKEYPTMIFGYTANYAAYVHEMHANVNWSRPGSGPYWLYKAIRKNEKEMLKILQENIKLD
jgi:hypothetical protein